MKKTITILLFISLLTGVYAQQEKPVLKPDPRLYETMSETQINDLLQNNPKEIVLANIKVAWFCFFAAKLAEENYQMMGDICQYIKRGKTCNPDKIIKDNAINPLDYNFPQDPHKSNVFPIGKTGNYIIVYSKERYEFWKKEILKSYGF
ncbi:MAG: hypothetical protein RR356_04150 [Bacteroidales bacterium]